MRVMIPIDGSECSKAAVEYVVERPWKADDTFMIVHVVEPIPVDIGIAYVPGAYTPDDPAAFEQSEALLKVVESELRATLVGHTIEHKVTGGPAKAELVDLTKEWKADMIVMGSHDRHGFNRLLLGSMAEDLMKAAHCSITVVKNFNCTK